jgi:type I restriction enzyme S subunit
VSDWSEIVLGAVADIKHGLAFKGEYFRDEPPGDFLLTPGNFRIGGGFQTGKEKYYDGPVPDEYVLEEGDLLVTMTDLSRDTATLGYPALMPAPPEGRLLHNQRLGKVLIRDEAQVDKGFLYYLMCSKAYRHEILASATGTTVKHTSPIRILKFQFRCPPLEMQQRIAHILGALDDKIELNRRMNRTLEAIARAIFKRWFIDFDPIIDNAILNGKPLPDEFVKRAEVRREILARSNGGEGVAGYRHLFPDSFQDSPLGKIPKGWEVMPLDQIADFVNGAACQKHPAEPGKPGLPVIKIRELGQGVSAQTDRVSLDIPDKHKADNGDVLFSWSGTLLCEIWTGGPCFVNQHLFKVTSDKYPRWFYLHWVKHHLEAFRGVASGKATTMGHIKRSHLSEAMTMVPGPELLDRMTEVIAPLVESQVRTQLESEALSAIRDSLLPWLLAGSLSVGDIPQPSEGEA